jgi:hypothetical protein
MLKLISESIPEVLGEEEEKDDTKENPITDNSIY